MRALAGWGGDQKVIRWESVRRSTSSRWGLGRKVITVMWKQKWQLQSWSFAMRERFELRCVFRGGNGGGEGNQWPLCPRGLASLSEVSQDSTWGWFMSEVNSGWQFSHRFQISSWGQQPNGNLYRHGSSLQHKVRVPFCWGNFSFKTHAVAVHQSHCTQKKGFDICQKAQKCLD